jgi:polyphosphate:AMP phosphotransferase
MFETAELGQKISREAFDAVAAPLRSEILALQQRLRSADFPVLIAFAGVDGAGKSEAVNLLNEWLDPRWIVTRAYDEPSQEERERPHFWRYWRDLPARGRIGLFLSGWYSNAILDRVYGKGGTKLFDYRLERIKTFERTLTDDGALILKFWMHLGKEAQKKRMQSLEADPLQSWRVSKKDWRNWKRYDKFIRAAELAIARTDDGRARWTIVEGQDARFRSLTVLNTLKDALSQHLAEREAAKPAARRRAGKKPAEIAPLTVLDRLDLTQTIPAANHDRQWREARAELALEARKMRERGVSCLLVFEGWDAAGKGGAVRRVTASLDARSCEVVPIAAPSDEERAHHYLWRFWRHLPRAGRFLIFDRSWYGRVLVERVEGFASADEWQRAYAEINDFEEQLLHHGIALGKFWLHISADEQLRRFKQREEIAYKQWKLTDEDWRNRAKWQEYSLAVHDMVEKTSTLHAPWTLVEGNDKNFARLKILRGVTGLLRRRLAQP